jgi:hypothetical protein
LIIFDARRFYMSKSTELFTLIRSLSSQEKGFFKVFCGRTNVGDDTVGAYIFVELFDDLNAFKGESEDEFCKINESKPYISNFSYYKNRLQKRIVDACLSMTNDALDHRLSRLLEEARFLRDRRMTKSCLKRLLKAQKIAQEYEKHEILLEILRLKRSLLMESKISKREEIMEVVNHLMAVGEIVANKYAYLQIKDRLFLEQKRRGRERKVHELKALDEIMQAPILQGGSPPISFDARHSLCFANAIYHQLKGDWDTAMLWHTQIFDLWKEAPRIREDRPVHFRSAMNNYLNLCCNCEMDDRFEEALAFMENPEIHSEDERLETLCNSLYIRLTHAIHQCNWPVVGEIVERYESNRPAIERKIHTSRLMAFYLQFAWCELVNQRYKEASDWVDEILSLGKPDIRSDIRNLGLLLKPIIRIEQGYNDILESDARSAYRQLSNSKDLLPYERAVIQLLNKVPDFINDDDSKAQMGSLKKNLEDFAKTESQQNTLGLEILIHWLESRIRKIDLRAVVEEKWLGRK